MQITETEAYDRYNDWLDEAYGDVVLGHLSYTASDVLRSTDPTAYRVGFADYVDSLADDGITVEGY